MDKSHVVILVIFAMVIAGAVSFPLMQKATVAASAADTIGGPALKPSTAGEFRGITLQLHSSYAKHPYEDYIDEIAATGANTISFVVTAYQENCSSTSLFIEARKSPTYERLKQIVAHAHEKGLRVILMPIVLLENPKEGEWRGKIKPTSWDDWWDRYTSYIMHYAQLAEETKVEVYMVGSELVSIESQTDRWRELIKQVRKTYKGRLSYSANWDHYADIKYWADLDMIGMTTYYDLTDGKKPSMDVLMESWKKIKKEVLDWQAKIDRPLLFTEVGWPNQVTCAQYPWDYYRSTNSPDEQAQANCFESFFQTWMSEKQVAGYLVWEWRSHPSQDIGPKDTSYVPCGKKALGVIRKYFQAPSPWEGVKTASDGAAAGNASGVQSPAANTAAGAGVPAEDLVAPPAKGLTE